MCGAILYKSVSHILHDIEALLSQVRNAVTFFVIWKYGAKNEVACESIIYHKLIAIPRLPNIFEVKLVLDKNAYKEMVFVDFVIKL